jgi:putative ABC transport system substrate-binding protein
LIEAASGDGGLARGGLLGRGVVLAVVIIGVLTTALNGAAQTTARKARVSVLGLAPSNQANTEMFKQRLAQLGYIGDQHVLIADRDANGDRARLAATAVDLVRAGADVIFARGPDALAAAVRATTTIPIVAIDLESDPVALKYAKTLARPGGNVTGVFLDLPELSGKQLQLVREVLPGLTRVALVGDPDHNAAQFRATERVAQALGVQVQTFGAHSAAELDAALESARRVRAGAVLIFSSQLVFYNRARIAALAREKRAPSVSLFAEFAEAGGLLTYGPSIREAFRRCGVYVGKILKGAKPGELPIERPETFELVINLKTARALGLTIPQSVQLRADRLID